LLEICVNDDHQGDKFDDNAKQQAKFESDKLINSVCYLRKCKGFKEKNKVLELLICSQDSYEQVQKNLIVPVSLNKVIKDNSFELKHKRSHEFFQDLIKIDDELKK